MRLEYSATGRYTRPLTARPCFSRLPCPVAMWKLRPEGLQGEYGKLAPRVTKHEAINSYIGKDGPSASPIPPRVAQDAWLGVALEELAQMCGAFLGATVSQPSIKSSHTSAGEHQNLRW